MASITTRNGRRCTAVPKLVQGIEAVRSSTSTSTSISTSTSETSSLSSTSTSISTSTSSSSSSSSISSSTAVNTPPAIENPAQQETPLPSEIFPSLISTIAAQPSTDPTIPATPPAPTITGTDGTSSSTALLLDTASTPSPTQSDAQVSSSAGPDDNPVQSASSLIEQPVDSSSLTSFVENTSLPTIGVTQASSSSAETGLPATQKAATGNAITTAQTIAIAAGVVGGVIVVSLIVFIIWFWRKRRQERRSSMLSPMSPRATFRGNEKGPYLISRTSLGPTPLPQKLWATIEARYRRLRGRFGDMVTRSSSPSPSVNLDRGNSQFGMPEPAHSRNNSNTGPSTDKGRPVDWWSRLAEDENSNWQLRRESDNNGPAFGSQPGRGLEKAQGSVDGNRRRSISVGNEQHFLGGIGLDFDSADPFSDVNAIGNNTAKATPLVVSAANNPFSDSHAIGAPSGAVSGGIATYVQHSRHSHSHSINGSISRQTSNASYRTSVGTVGTRRNRFRSDPFDLDRPDFLRSANSSMDATAGWASTASRSSTDVGSVPNAPQQAHVRNASFTSKYSSGVSTVGWSDPGPDVGPVVGRYTLSPDSRPERRDSRDSDAKSGKSQGSVGKAL
ncbi:hypothetical protein F5Y00DRAFT_185266 [Daldinia vernicosa]|uniref:uncharacterized protein n=1 Tax=Daldinia vernicosa TaxID=114800 RepID=UPI0020074962|nr:uncharacterized protein F5Y00DRAFT_185266 [Daldinia vernicosa]KAI0844880.1 hypothetical protein F5Y00DRAFT_185266 [Daldinia vernicosa]